VRHNVIYYCLRETILGSHFEQKSCRTAERIAAERNTAYDITVRAQIETIQTMKP
jgi:Zn/Cd-binding protein ZinT